MKKFITLITVCLFYTGAVSAQEAGEHMIIPIDLDSVRIAATPEKYAEVLARFETLDENFTYDDAIILYYGWAFQPGYKGSSDAIYSPVAKLIQKGKYKQAWEKGVEYLKDNPVSLTTYEGMLMAAIPLDMKDQAEPYMIRMLALLDIIRSSGDGKSEDTPFIILAVSDEYTFMRHALGINNVQGQALLKEKYDVISINSAKFFDGNKIYFDVSLPLRNLLETLEN